MTDTTDPIGGPPNRAGFRLDSTAELVERARLGDQEAVDRLFARHLKPLQRWASGRLPAWARDLNDTDDLVQDTLVKTFKRVEVFEARSKGALQAYLRQAVLNRLRDELRRKRRRPDQTDLDDLELEAGTSPLEDAIGREEVEAYDNALTRLSGHYRQAIIARIELGMSYEQLAETLGKTSPDAARKTAQRALLRLARELKRARG
jgi:RNA polymerase sigma-70 factor (ECF subfamily)